MRALAIGAQAVFVGGWIVAGALEPGYSWVEQPVSELAVPGAANPWLVVVALLAWAAGFAALAAAGPARGLWAACAVLAVALAFLPLDCAGCRGPHSWHHEAHLVASSLLELVVLCTPFALRRPGIGAIGIAAWLAITVAAQQGLAQRLGFLLIAAWAITIAPGATPSRRSPRPARPRPAAGR